MSVPALRWRAVPREALAWRNWNGDLVVRNQCSGSTHLLEPLAGQVMLALIALDDAATVEDLAAAIEAPANVQAPATIEESDWGKSIEGVLSEFERLGLALPEAR